MGFQPHSNLFNEMTLVFKEVNLKAFRIKKKRENRLLLTFKPVKNPNDNTAAKYYHYPSAEELSKFAFLLS